MENELYNIKIDDRYELAYIFNNEIYTLDINSITQVLRGAATSKSKFNIACSGNKIPIWKLSNIISIKSINSDEELVDNFIRRD